MKTNFTPGPWEIDHDGTVGHIKSVSPLMKEYQPGKKYTPTVARYDIFSNCGDLKNPPITIEEEKANAQLIASAPELLESLQEMVESCICRSGGYGIDGFERQPTCSVCDNAKETITKAIGEIE